MISIYFIPCDQLTENKLFLQQLSSLVSLYISSTALLPTTMYHAPKGICTTFLNFVSNSVNSLELWLSQNPSKRALYLVVTSCQIRRLL